MMPLRLGYGDMMLLSRLHAFGFLAGAHSKRGGVTIAPLETQRRPAPAGTD